MGLLQRAFSARSSSLENPDNPIKPSAVLELAGGGPSKSGVAVSQESASRLTAFWCGTRILAETLASVPLCVYERVGRGRVKAVDHPLYPILHDELNDEMSSMFGREVMQAQLIYHGNAYARILRAGSGEVGELWPLISQRVQPKREKGRKVFQALLNDGSIETFQQDEILQIPGLSFDGLKGKSVIGAARDALGVGLAAQDYAGTFYKTGGRVPGVVETQLSKMDPETKKNLGETWLSGRSDNWHQVAFLPRGMKYTPVGIPPDDAQFLDSRKFGVTEIARILNIPPHFLKDLERATFANIEQQSLEFVIYTMRPIFVRWEQELNRRLLVPAERRRYYIAFNMEALMRGDTAARGAFYALGRQWGFFSANDVLELEDRPGIGEKGDVYLTPINMVNAEDLVNGSAGNPGLYGRQLRHLETDLGAEGKLLTSEKLRRFMREMAARTGIRGLALRRRIRKSQKPVIEDRAQTIVNREIGAVEKLIKPYRSTEPRSRRGLTDLRREIEAFYDDHGAWAAAKMAPVNRSYADLIAGAMADELGTDAGDELPAEFERFVKDYTEHFGKREASEGKLQLLALLDEYQAEGEEAAAEAVAQRLTEWGDKRAGKIAGIESVRFMSAAAKTLYVAGGVTVLRWVANAEACSFCQGMDGKKAGVEANFVDAGQGVDGGEGTDGPMRPSDNIGHPPLHDSCECDVVAD